VRAVLLPVLVVLAVFAPDSFAPRTYYSFAPRTYYSFAPRTYYMARPPSRGAVEARLLRSELQLSGSRLVAATKRWV
jgi:hypothetical protein